MEDLKGSQRTNLSEEFLQRMLEKIERLDSVISGLGAKMGAFSKRNDTIVGMRPAEPMPEQGKNTPSDKIQNAKPPLVEKLAMLHSKLAEKIEILELVDDGFGAELNRLSDFTGD